jgi:photosystem II stability/assembly factor-like uncharacterized protein
MIQLLLATDSGLVICEREGEKWRETFRTLVEHHITSVIAREGVILAGTPDGIYRSDDSGQTWQTASQGLSSRHVRWLAYHPEISDREFAGTEPAGIFVSHNGGGSWRVCPEVDEYRDTHKWSLPYSPQAGCVRGFAFRGPRAYAAVEVGGVLRSDDYGETWRLADGSDGNPDLEGPLEPFIYPDVHSIVVHPFLPNLVYAPTGGGFYRSTDGGKTWKCVYDCYCRAVWVDVLDSQHMILGPADGVDRNGRIEESHDGGETWTLASNGIEVPWLQGMVERFIQVAGELVAVLSDGRLLSASQVDLEWSHIMSDITGVAAVSEFGINR